MILKLFTTTKYDNCNIIKTANKVYSLKTIKTMIANKMEQIKGCSNNVIILPDDNFAFIINFFASIFSNKNIYLITESQKICDFEGDYYVLKNEVSDSICDYSFQNIDSNEVIINFFTSGSTKESQNIKKTLANLIEEGLDVTEALDLANKELVIKSSTTFCHLFGMTFGLMFPLCNRYLIDTEKVLYPENLDTKKCFFVSSPAFLNALKKHSLPFSVTPDYIIAAGAKLEDETFNYFEQKSSVIEIYGSTETGVIAYRKNSSEKNLTIFPNVKFENKDTIISKYIYGYKTSITDDIEFISNKISVIGRKDRIIKIYDKRVSLEFIEATLNSNEMVEKSYCFKFKTKLACVCVLSEIGKNLLFTRGVNELKKYLKNDLRHHTDVVPQKWFFNNCIPTTQTGKFDKAFIDKIFAVNFSFPIILDSIKSKDKVTYKIFFNKNCNFYNGHFPDFPITPGVAQLYIATELANYSFKLNTTVGQIKKIKFSNIIHPNTIIDLSLTKKETGIEYVFFDATLTYSSGTLPIKNIFKGEV